jgi:hypothetical protein
MAEAAAIDPSWNVGIISIPRIVMSGFPGHRSECFIEEGVD